MNGNVETAPKAPTSKRLILCLDGTGNAFLGNTSDTNVVKLYNLFDRSDPYQMHYYQPGIGTYTEGGSVNTGFFGGIGRSISQTIDTGLATSFDAHVIAGYRFLMRYYQPGDRIYIFGFSRGAFTARFLARMIYHVGLLSMGNEEMVSFAYKVYQDYEMDSGNEVYMYNFRKAFCRDEHVAGEDGEAHHLKAHKAKTTQNKQRPADPNPDTRKPWTKKELAARSQKLEYEASVEALRAEAEHSAIKVHFLGLFDTVNSVGTLDIPWAKAFKVPKVLGTAQHVRHAVAIDERRVKFKAALLSQDVDVNKNEDIKEVWFPGNHGDVGGGWPAEPEETGSLWKRFWKSWRTRMNGDPSVNKDNDRFQLSDIAQKWMIDELEHIDGDELKWNKTQKEDFLQRFHESRKEAIESKMHDTMRLGGGSSWGKSLFWNFMEFLPFIKRWEYFLEQDSKFFLAPLWRNISRMPTGRASGKAKAKSTAQENWHYITFPLNGGGRRDMPPGALVHHSVLERMEGPFGYGPTNDIYVPDIEQPIKLNAVQRRGGQDEGLEIVGKAPVLGMAPHFHHVPEKSIGHEEWDRIYKVEGVPI